MEEIKNPQFDEDFFDDLKEPEEQSFSGDNGYPVQVYFHELSRLYMKSIAWNWHPEIEIIIINHGDVVFMTNDKKESLHAGQGVVVNANVMHSIVPENEDANCSMYSTKFSPSFLFETKDPSFAERYLLPVINSRTFQYMTLDEENDKEARLLEFINGVIALNLVKNFGFELLTKARLCEFWIALMNSAVPETMQKKSAGSVHLDEQRVKEMIHYIEEHYSEKITLEELASSVHISRSECCRCFKRSLNLTPIEYLMRYRILKAASMIRKNPPLNISFSELAYQVGFNNASYFNKVFRQYLNCTPGEYKKKIKEDPNFDLFGSITL